MKISKKSVKLARGKTITLKIKNKSKKTKVKWKTSKKSVATVSKKGKVKAKKPGTATITAKVGKRKFKCKVKVYDPKGSRYNPANPKQGVTLQAPEGTMYYKLTNIYKGEAAINRLLSMGEWSTYKDEEYRERPNDNVAIFQFYVKAKSGFHKSPLYGDDVFSPYSVYNSSCNKAINGFDSIYLNNKYEHNDRFNFEIYNGASGTMYSVVYVPKSIKSFSLKHYTKSYDDYWVRYSI